jgi:hypothetical protein
LGELSVQIGIVPNGFHHSHHSLPLGSTPILPASLQHVLSLTLAQLVTPPIRSFGEEEVEVPVGIVFGWVVESVGEGAVLAEASDELDCTAEVDVAGEPYLTSTGVPMSK